MGCGSGARGGGEPEATPTGKAESKEAKNVPTKEEPKGAKPAKEESKENKTPGGKDEHPNANKSILIIGGPASGKGTQGERITKKFNFM